MVIQFRVWGQNVPSVWSVNYQNLWIESIAGKFVPIKVCFSAKL